VIAFGGVEGMSKRGQRCSLISSQKERRTMREDAGDSRVYEGYPHA